MTFCLSLLMNSIVPWSFVGRETSAARTLFMSSAWERILHSFTQSFAAWISVWHDCISWCGNCFWSWAQRHWRSPEAIKSSLRSSAITWKSSAVDFRRSQRPWRRASPGSRPTVKSSESRCAILRFPLQFPKTQGLLSVNKYMVSFNLLKVLFY